MKNIGSLMKLQNLVLSVLPNPPYSLNKDYTQIYNIPAEKTGTSPALQTKAQLQFIEDYVMVLIDSTHVSIRISEQQIDTLDLRLQ